MTERAFASVDGHTAVGVRLHVPNVGAWFADVELEEDPDLSGAVVLRLGESEWKGTIDPRYNGTRGRQRSCRIVAGAGAWGALLAPRAYQNDQGVKARPVAEDAARSCGEQLGTFSPASERLGAYYVRRAGAASVALEDASGGLPWWVDASGVTHVGERAAVDAAEGSYEVLEHDPRSRVVLLAVDDPLAVGIGSVLTERLDDPQTVRELELVVSADAVRVHAWCGGSSTSRGRLAGALASVVERLGADRIWGAWRYRVIRMSADRVELQAVSRRAGLPDVLPVAMSPGVAGAHAALTPGSVVLVEFVEGSPTMPVITGFAGKGEGGWAPVSLTFDATTIKLGKDATDHAASAEAVAVELGKIASALTAVANGGGASTGANTYTTPGSVAASKVLVE